MTAPVTPTRASRRDSNGTPATQSRRWLLERYWVFAWLMLGAAIPMLLLWGARADVLGIGMYVAITAIGWLVARRTPAIGARLHLVAMFPYWSWYVGLDGGLPQRLDAGVAEYAVLLVFPMLTLVAVEGVRGALAGVALGAGGLFWRWTALDVRMEGVFLLSTAVLIGLVFRRLARELDQAHERMRHMAYHDELTGLPNRRELQARARDWLASDSPGALLFVDLDRFKTVNDVMGHGCGDDVLRLVGKRMQAVCSEPHLLARIGGDEFAVLLHGVEEQEASEIGATLLGAVREPCDLSGRTVHVGASIGIALWPAHGRDLDALMKGADVAMFHAKQDDVPISVHRPKRDGDTLDSRGLEVDLYRALENDELFLQYQPVKNPHNDEIAGAEALVRWQHPDKGVLPPANFIELAEETGHIIAIDRWVLRHALAQLRVFDEHGYKGFVAVNLSARSLEDDDFLADLALALEEEKVKPERLVLEITESAAMLDPEVSLKRLEGVEALGVGVAIDDFGMGYSSLAYLKRFPATHVKLDRSFTRGIGKHPRDEEIIELVLQLAGRFELDVVAEGVEEPHQLKWLTERGCDLVQGFGIARPMGPGEFVTTSLGVSAELEVATPSNRGATRLRGTARARRSLNPRRAG